MGKKIFFTENQLKEILNEELGIAKLVSDYSRELKYILYNHINSSNEGEFDFKDIKIIYKVYNFNTEEEYFDWIYNNTDNIINGYSFNNKTLYLTILKIKDNFDVRALDETIQHELEHYYQTKMAGKDFSSEKYQNLYKYIDDYNDYIKYISLIEYFNNIEIDAFINGAYNSVKELKVKNYNDFIENTDLKIIKNTFNDAYNFFANCLFSGPFFIEMINFINRNKLYKNSDNLKSLRKNILNKIEEKYNYFIRKTSRTYALIIKENNDKYKNILKIKNRFKIKGDS